MSINTFISYKIFLEISDRMLNSVNIEIYILFLMPVCQRALAELPECDGKMRCDCTPGGLSGCSVTTGVSQEPACESMGHRR